jgi:SNF2 family DNA or RNA helicase
LLFSVSLLSVFNNTSLCRRGTKNDDLTPAQRKNKAKREAKEQKVDEFVNGLSPEHLAVYTSSILTSVTWRRIGIDEIHTYRNMGAKNSETRTLYLLKSWHRIGLSGTWYCNNPKEFFTTLGLLYQDTPQSCYGNFKWWTALSNEEMAKTTSDIFISLFKESDLGLPGSVAKNSLVKINSIEKEIYALVANEAIKEFKWIKELKSADRAVFNQNLLVWLVFLRQICNDPRLPSCDASEDQCGRCRRVQDEFVNVKQSDERVKLSKGLVCDHMLCQYCNDEDVRCKVCLGLQIREMFNRKAVLESLLAEHQSQAASAAQAAASSDSQVPAQALRISPESDRKLFAGGRPTDVHSVKTRALISIVHERLRSAPNSKLLIFSEWKTYLVNFVLDALRAAFNVTLFDNRAPRAPRKASSSTAAAASSSAWSDDEDEGDEVVERPAKRQKQAILEDGDDSEPDDDGSVSSPIAEKKQQRPDVIDLDNNDLMVFQFYGGMSKGASDRMRKAFVAYKGPAVMLVTGKAGGVGLNLAGKDINSVINAELPYNPAELEQQTARVCRIGQTDVVHVYRLFTDNSVDDGLLRMHGRKESMKDFLVHQVEIRNDEIKAVAAASSKSEAEEASGVSGMSSDPMIDDASAGQAKNKRKREAMNAVSAFHALDTVFRELIDAYKRAGDAKASQGDESMPALEADDMS